MKRINKKNIEAFENSKIDNIQFLVGGRVDKTTWSGGGSGGNDTWDWKCQDHMATGATQCIYGDFAFAKMNRIGDNEEVFVSSSNDLFGQEPTLLQSNPEYAY